MTTPVEVKPGPFTHRQRQGCWEVLVIVEGEFDEYVPCRTEQDAKALSNWRLFHHMCEFPRLYKPEEIPRVTEVERTLAALQEYGFSTAFGYRQLERFAERLRGVTT
jgi:hypothetical protein